MADRFLSEVEWKRFTKANEFKDVVLGKALGALENAKEPEDQIKALDDLDKALGSVKKDAKNNKDVSNWLESVGKSADKQRKESELALKQKADDEEDDPVLLTSKMIPLLRQVKKGEQMHVLLARGGKQVAVLMSRKSISPARRKLLAEYLDDGTPKFHKGVCIFEEKSYTFVLETQAGGLAKKVKAALLKQVDLRLKVRVRGEDPNDLDDDGEPAEDDGLEAEGEEGKQTRGSVPEAPPMTRPQTEEPGKADYEKKWPAVEKRVLALLRDGAGDVSKMRAVVGFVQGKIEGGNYLAALQGMASLEKLMDAAQAIPEAPPQPSGEKPEPKGSTDADTAAFEKRVDVLKKAIPAAVAAVPANREAARDIVLKISEASVLWRKGERDRPKAMLDEAEAELKALPKVATPEQEGGEQQGEQTGEEPKSDDPKAAEHAKLLARLQPLYDKATSGGGLSGEQQATLQKVTTAWSMASDSAADKNYERALLILNRLDQGGMLASLAGPRETGPMGDRSGLIKQRSFMVKEWGKIPGELRGQLQSLRAQLEDADEDADDLVDGIEDSLEELLSEIQNDMDQAINDGDASIFKGLRERARSDELMKHLQAAPGFNGGGLLASVEGALTRIEQNMLATQKAA